MPNLQVREVPTAVYGALADASKQEHRSLAQQALVTLERGLGMAEDPVVRRRRIIQAIRESPVDGADALPAAADLVRKDRSR